MTNDKLQLRLDMLTKFAIESHGMRKHLIRVFNFLLGSIETDKFSFRHSRCYTILGIDTSTFSIQLNELIDMNIIQYTDDNELMEYQFNYDLETWKMSKVNNTI